MKKVFNPLTPPFDDVSDQISDITGLQTALDSKVDENSAITPATKTKITYDAKGLVTAGADATTADIADSSNKRYVTDAQQTVIGNTSGTNSGDVTLSGEDYLTISSQVITANAIDIDNLSATGTPSGSNFLRGDNVWATPAGGGDVVGPASSVDNNIVLFDGVTGKLIKDSTVNLSSKVEANGAITGATKTKITYDAKGLVTAGADATTADIADSTNKRYVTDAQQTVITNTSGTNTGDQVLPTRASLGLDTTDSPQFAAVNIGNATDTTVARVSAGKISVEGVDVVTISSSDTLTNKTLTSPVINTGVSGTAIDTDGTLAANSDTKLASQKATKTYVDTVALNPTGSITQYAGRTAPTGWLVCDGAAVSRSTYSALFNVASPTVGTFTVTIATPAVVTLNSHGLLTGAQVFLTTTGALPTGLAANTLYYIIKVTDNTFNLATSLANAYVGTKINTSGSQSGTHTLVFCPYGLGDGSTTFNVPSLKGRVPVGIDTADADFDTLGKSGGAKTHTLTTAEMPSHTHTMNISNNGAGGGGQRAVVTTSAVTNDSPNISAGTSAATGGGAAHNNLQPFVSLNYIIKT